MDPGTSEWHFKNAAEMGRHEVKNRNIIVLIMINRLPGRTLGSMLLSLHPESCDDTGEAFLLKACWVAMEATTCIRFLV